MRVPDMNQATTTLLEADQSLLKHRTFNVAAISFTPEQLARSIRKFLPGFTITYRPDFRQAIADSWPRSLNDQNARTEWGWKPSYDLEAMTKDMLEKLAVKLNVQPPK